MQLYREALARRQLMTRLGTLQGKDAVTVLEKLDQINESLQLLGSGQSALTRVQWKALDRAQDAVDWVLK